MSNTQGATEVDIEQIVETREDYLEIAETVKKIMMREIEEREPPDRIWLTDTVYCGRKKIFRMMGYEEWVTEDALNRLWLGRIVGAALEAMGIAREIEVEYRGVKGRIDCIVDTGEPVEIKTIHTLYSTVSSYAESHVEQLSRYCLAVGKPVGIIFYYVPGVKISSLPAYRYRFNLDIVKSIVDERIDLLVKAAKAQEPFILPATWHSATMKNWECRKCMFQAICLNRGGL